MANEVELLANLLFSETKNIDDAKGVANVVLNRMKRPQRFGGSLEEVVFAPSQFSGVGSNEWEKARSRKFTEKEAGIYKQFISVAGAALRGQLDDPTGGADHYVNLKEASPSWAKQYKKTGQIGKHTYFSEKKRK